MEDRKGFFTPEQEKQLDALIALKGIAEAVDGTAIRMADNIGMQKLKEKIPSDVLPIVYEVIDELMAALEVIQVKG